ncbi:hypothetical protein FRC08_009524 [Ceratobasidium sp. 394]|nr:hypothetical protein FRC08_009524 [Ceratobasidium sp. 394]
MDHVTFGDLAPATTILPMSNNQTHPDASNLPYYVATYKSRSVAIKRDPDYQTTIKLVQKSIPKLRPANVEDIFISTTLANYGDALVQVSEEIWPDIVGDVKTVEITLESDDHAASDANMETGNQDESAATLATGLAQTTRDTHHQASCSRDTELPVNHLTTPRDSFSILVRTISQQYLELDNLASSSKVRDIKSLIEARYHVPAAFQRLELLGERLQDAKTLEQSGIAEWTIVDVGLGARQCMFILFPRTAGQIKPTNNIEVHFSFNRAWEFAMHRPTMAVPPEDFIQTASWKVDLTKDGVLFDHGSKAEQTYIFWDGVSQHAVPAELTSSPSQSSVASRALPSDWSKFFPLICPQNSVAVPSGNVYSYVESVFCEIGFRGYHSTLTSYFISRLQDKPCEYLALRFISQSECKTIASLSTSPPTPFMGRVLVLYKRLSSTSAAKLWDNFRPTYEQGANIWKDIARAKSAENWLRGTYFAVAEISWMEIF